MTPSQGKKCPDWLNYFLCAFFGHKFKTMEQLVMKTKISETFNCTEFCERCGVLGEQYGITHIGPFQFTGQTGGSK